MCNGVYCEGSFNEMNDIFGGMKHDRTNKNQVIFQKIASIPFEERHLVYNGYNLPEEFKEKILLTLDNENHLKFSSSETL